jgi:phage shock protein C
VNTRRLYRSRNDKQLAGVAGGMAEYLDIDPTLVRVLWILSVFLGGFTILLYVILAFIMPLAPAGPAGPSWGPGPNWGPGGAWASGSAPAAGGAPANGAEAAGGEPTADVSPTQGWNAAQAGWDPAWTGSQGWTVQGAATGPAEDRRHGPGAAVYAGVLLVVFGTIALADVVIPGLSGMTLVPALLVGLGAALLIGSMRRSAGEA